ncbi:MAG: GrpB family protein [Thermomicrobiales bacterium]
MSNTIRIVPYDRRWPDEFRQIGQALRTVLGDLALRIDHIGSTSVPGLAAKDIIDIQVTVHTLDAAALSTALARPGYTRIDGITRDHVPPGGLPATEEWQKLYFRPPPGQRPTHLHVRQQGRANQRYPLLFRDCLRANPATAEAYRQIKEALARQDPEDVDAYYAVKDPVCDIIIDVARAWAGATGYQPGPSDA